MQTFLPYPDFAKSAACLDTKRLGKQRVEAKQIWIASGNSHTYGWRYHPAVKMWRNSRNTLCLYGIAICQEWIQRGYKDSLLPWFQEKIPTSIAVDTPLWLGVPSFHLSHQSNLVRKLPSHYRQFFPDVPDDLPYIWPVS